MAKVMSEESQAHHGAELQRRIDTFAQAVDVYSLKMEAAEARGYLNGMVDFGGLPVMIGEAWEGRIKKAEQAQMRRLKPRKIKEKPPTDAEVEAAMEFLFR